MNLNWLYTAVSWIMLRWHDLWSWLLGDEAVLGTNWAWILSIIFLVITVRILLFPLFVKQIKSQRAMQALQPKIKELQEKHKGDRESFQREVMELYRQEKANPLMGCLPMFLQVPVFISLFWILGRRLDPGRVEKVNAGLVSLADSNIELYGWKFEQYASAAHATLFDAPIAAVFFEGGWFDRELPPGTSMLAVRLVAGVLTLIMVLTTFLTTRQMMRRTGWATDPTQLMMQRLMVYGIPGMLLFSGLFFPISVILYWVVNNLFSLAQQQWVLRKYPPPATAMAGGGPNGAKPAGRRPQPARGKAGADGRAADQPRVDGRLLAPKPGAKPVRNVPPKRKPSSANVPPRRGGSGQRKG
ncbi:MAG TPA: membrane protein insertase YidC [Natronosporangium sp.]|nr:membrane protein insertase YidC [Natronosporangium sp.]